MNLLTKKSRERLQEKPLTGKVLKKYLAQLKNSWEVVEGRKITNTFKFKNFREAMTFVNKVAELAESENHHPDINIHYNKVRLNLTTHSVGGISENDFILAAKIQQLIL